MANISEDTIQRVISVARIEDIVGDFVELVHKGPRLLGLCPFHDDRNIGSFVVYPKKNCYKCFACNAQGDAIRFLEMHKGMSFLDAVRYIGQKYGVQVDDVPVHVAPTPVRPAPPPLPMLTLPPDMVWSREKDIHQNALVKWIYRLPWDETQLARVTQVLKSYHIGHSQYGHTIFWQIDDNMKVRTGKMMLYRHDGHRDKESKWNFDYVHATLFRSPNFPEYSDDKMELKQTLFGMHMIDKFNADTDIRIVESEKTAVLMAIAYGNNEKMIWMACGGVKNLTSERLAPIIRRHRRIILYPDRDGITEWQSTAAALNYDRITVDTRPVTPKSEGGWWTEEDGPKADIADVILRYLTYANLLNRK